MPLSDDPLWEEDLYTILGIEPDASNAQIKLAQRLRTLQVQDKVPDSTKSRDATVRLQKINQAAEWLLDDRIRREYDEARSRRGSPAPEDDLEPARPIFDPTNLDFGSMQLDSLSLLVPKTIIIRYKGGTVTEDTPFDVPRRTGSFWRIESVEYPEDEFFSDRVIGKVQVYLKISPELKKRLEAKLRAGHSFVELSDTFIVTLDGNEARLPIRIKMLAPKPSSSSSSSTSTRKSRRRGSSTSSTSRPKPPPSTSGSGSSDRRKRPDDLKRDLDALKADVAKTIPSPPTPPIGTPAVESPPGVNPSKLVAGSICVILLLLPFLLGWQRVFVGGVPIEDNNIWMSMWLAVGGAEAWEEADAISKGECLNGSRASSSTEADGAAGAFVPFFILSWLLSLPVFLAMPIGSVALWGGSIYASYVQLGDGDPPPKAILGSSSIPLIIGLAFLVLSGLALRGALHFGQCG